MHKIFIFFLLTLTPVSLQSGKKSLQGSNRKGTPYPFLRPSETESPREEEDVKFGGRFAPLGVAHTDSFKKPIDKRPVIIDPELNELSSVPKKSPAQLGEPTNSGPESGLTPCLWALALSRSATSPAKP